MRRVLVKITKNEYLESNLRGGIYMNNIERFRALENAAQGDLYEGTSRVIEKEDMESFGFNLNKQEKDAIIGPMVFLDETYKNVNLFCMYQLLIDDDNHKIQKPSKKLLDFNSDIAIVILDPDEFIKRVESKIREELLNENLIYYISGDVNYNISLIDDMSTFSTSFFNKINYYSYQQEWRIAISFSISESGARTLEIGDIRDITKVVSLNELLDGSWIDGYQISEEFEYKASSYYRSLTNLHTIPDMVFNKFPNEILLKDISPIIRDKFGLFENDLKARGAEVVATDLLEKSVLTKSIEYLELFSILMLRSGNPLLALETYLELLTTHESIVKHHAVRFFRNYLDIFLLFRRELCALIDHRKMFKIASTKYSVDVKDLPRESIISHMHLGLFTYALDELDALSSDRHIFSYYYIKAVCYLITLDFESANKVINEIEVSFSGTNISNKSQLNLLKSIIETIQKSTYHRDNKSCGCDKDVYDKNKNITLILTHKMLDNLLTNDSVSLLSGYKEVIIPSNLINNLIARMFKDKRIASIINFLKNRTNYLIRDPNVDIMMDIYDKDSNLSLSDLIDAALIATLNAKSEV